MNKKHLLSLLILLISFVGIGVAQTLSVGQGYKYGDINWQASPDSIAWADIAGENALEYDVPEGENKYYRAQVAAGTDAYYSTAYNSYAIEYITSTISFKLPAGTDPNKVNINFSPLKYNKKFAVSLTSDDQKLDAWRTFNYINQGWLSDEQNHHAQLPQGKGAYSIKLFTYTDGCGVKRRFPITTSNFYNRKYYEREDDQYVIDNANPNLSNGELAWKEIKEINDFDGACSFHDVYLRKGANVVPANEAQVKEGIAHSNEIIARGLGNSKRLMVMTEPANIAMYTNVALELPQFRAIMKGSSDTAPKAIDLAKGLLPNEKMRIDRYFLDGKTSKEMESRFKRHLLDKAKDGVYPYFDLGIHGLEKDPNAIGNYWQSGKIWNLERMKFLGLLYDEYGDGNAKKRDNMWFATPDEIVQYKLLNEQTVVKKTVNSGVMTITLTIPKLQDFYWFEYTLLIDGVNAANVVDVKVDRSVVGFSYGNSEGKMMLNLNYDQSLIERADRYLSEYEKNKNNPQLKDASKRNAEYFIQRLKPETQKDYKAKLNK